MLTACFVTDFVTDLGPRRGGDRVHKITNALEVTPVGPRTKQRVTSKAAYGTKLRFLAALRRMWKLIFPTRTAPFAGAHVERTKTPGVQSTEVSGFEDHKAFVTEATNGALEPSQVLRALAAGMYLDERNACRANTRDASVPNTAHAMAISAGSGTRVCEALRLVRHWLKSSPNRQQYMPPWPSPCLLSRDWRSL